MKTSTYFFGAVAMLWMLLGCFGRSHAQGIVTFDGSPVIPPGNDVGVTYYLESGMTFRPIDQGDQFGRAGGGREAFPENSTAYILQGAFDTIAGSLGGVSRFGLTSVDLAEFSTLYNFPATIQFVGYHFDGTVVSTEFITDGIIDGAGPLADFQTFFFDARFSDLVRFESPSHTYAMDNLVFFSPVPEPSSCALLGLGLLVMGVWRLKRKREL